MFWVGLDTRLIPPDEFQADSPQNSVQQGPAPRHVLHAVLAKTAADSVFMG